MNSTEMTVATESLELLFADIPENHSTHDALLSYRDYVKLCVAEEGVSESEIPTFSEFMGKETVHG